MLVRAGQTSQASPLPPLPPFILSLYFAFVFYLFYYYLKNINHSITKKKRKQEKIPVTRFLFTPLRRYPLRRYFRIQTL